MKITEIKYIKSLVPNMSCGTGYSEPDKFHIICDNGFETDVWIDIWYRTEKDIPKCFKEGLGKYFENIENFNKAFEMYKSEIKKLKVVLGFGWIKIKKYKLKYNITL